MAEPPLRSALVTVGDELLLGRTVDTNAARLGEWLAELGAPVVERSTVGDDDARIRDGVERMLERAPIVVVSGGLGPTDDDRTRPAVAGLLDRPLRLDEELEAALQARYRDRGYDEMPPANRSQCMVPEGGTVLPNARGTAPGLWLEVGDGRIVVLLPGPPRELEAVFPHAADLLRERFAERLRPLRHRTIHTTGIPESVLAPRVEEAVGPDREVAVAFLPDLTGVDIRLTVQDAPSDDDAIRRLDEAEAVVDRVVGGARFRTEGAGHDLIEAVADGLRETGTTVAVAESCTGGLLAKRLTDRPGSSAWFAGGVVAYSNAAKAELVGVDPGLIDRKGAVSREVAEALAEGARRRFGTDVGLGVTGIAGPSGGSDDKPVGTVWYALAERSGVESWRQVFPGDREAVRIRTTQAVLDELRRHLEALR